MQPYDGKIFLPFYLITQETEPRETATQGEWRGGVLDGSVATEYLQEVCVLSYHYWVTSLCGKSFIKGPCINLTVNTNIQLNRDLAAVFTAPEDILRYPIFIPIG